MRSQTLAFLSAAGSVAAQGVTSAIAPTATAPDTCVPSMAGNFEITIVDASSASAMKKRQEAACDGSGILVAALSDSVIMDSQGRTGYIASNYQFQFDAPPQAGAIYTAGFTACANGSLALGGSTVWYECASGNFFNLYDRSWAAQCSPVEIMMVPCNASAEAAGESGDGQVVGTQVITTTVVMPLSDGQPQVIATTIPVPICQITDGQLQVHTTPCASVTAMTSAASVPAPVSQFSDGQIQVTQPGASPSLVTLATETMPTATAESSPAVSEPAGTPAAPSNGTMITAPAATSAKSSAAMSSPNSAATGASSAASSSAATSAPAASGASESLRVGSLAALLVGFAAAVWVL